MRSFENSTTAPAKPKVTYKDYTSYLQSYSTNNKDDQESISSTDSGFSTSSLHSESSVITTQTPKAFSAYMKNINAKKFAPVKIPAEETTQPQKIVRSEIFIHVNNDEESSAEINKIVKLKPCKEPFKKPVLQPKSPSILAKANIFQQQEENTCKTEKYNNKSPENAKQNNVKNTATAIITRCNAKSPTSVVANTSSVKINNNNNNAIANGSVKSTTATTTTKFCVPSNVAVASTKVISKSPVTSPSYRDNFKEKQKLLEALTHATLVKSSSTPISRENCNDDVDFSNCKRSGNVAKTTEIFNNNCHYQSSSANSSNSTSPVLSPSASSACISSAFIPPPPIMPHSTDTNNAPSCVPMPPPPPPMMPMSTTTKYSPSASLITHEKSNASKTSTLPPRLSAKDSVIEELKRRSMKKTAREPETENSVPCSIRVRSPSPLRQSNSFNTSLNAPIVNNKEITIMKSVKPVVPKFLQGTVSQNGSSNLSNDEANVKTVVLVADEQERLQKNDANVKKMVYNTYRGLLGAYHNKANESLATLPRGCVVKSDGVSKQLETLALQGGLEKLTGRANPKNDNE